MEKIMTMVGVLRALKTNGYVPHYGVEGQTVMEGQKKYSTKVSFGENKTTFTFEAYTKGWDTPFVNEIKKLGQGVSTDWSESAKRTVIVEVPDSEIEHDRELAKLLKEHRESNKLEQDIHLYIARKVGFE